MENDDDDMKECYDFSNAVRGRIIDPSEYNVVLEELEEQIADAGAVEVVAWGFYMCGEFQVTNKPLENSIGIELGRISDFEAARAADNIKQQGEEK